MKNCWDFMSCGRAGSYGCAATACPAATCTAADSIHFGHNGGRACWALDGTFCAGGPQNAAEKQNDCASCAFYHRVRRDEGPLFISTAEIRLLVYGTTPTAPASTGKEHP